MVNLFVYLTEKQNRDLKTELNTEQFSRLTQRLLELDISRIYTLADQWTEIEQVKYDTLASLINNTKIQHLNYGFLTPLKTDSKFKKYMRTRRCKAYNKGKKKFKCIAYDKCLVIDSDGCLRICPTTRKLGDLMVKSVQEILLEHRSKKVIGNREMCMCDNDYFIQSWWEKIKL